jgi:hypothetical protein
MSSLVAARERTEAPPHRPGQVTQTEVISCKEIALGRPPAAGMRNILGVVKNRVALMRHTLACWDVQIGLPVPQGSHLAIGEWPIRHLIRFCVRAQKTPGWVQFWGAGTMYRERVPIICRDDEPYRSANPQCSVRLRTRISLMWRNRRHSGKVRQDPLFACSQSPPLSSNVCRYAIGRFDSIIERFSIRLDHAARYLH